MNYKKTQNKPLYIVDEYKCKTLTPYGSYVNKTLFEYEKRVKVLEREYLELLYENREIKALCQYKDLAIQRQRAELKGKDEIITKFKAVPFDSDSSQWYSMIKVEDVKNKFSNEAKIAACLVDESGKIKEFISLFRRANKWVVEKTSLTLEEYLKKNKYCN